MFKKVRSSGALLMRGVLVLALGTLAAGCSEENLTEPPSSSPGASAEGLDLEGNSGSSSSSGFSFGSEPGPRFYEVTIENLTPGQPFSPPVAATHHPSMRLWDRRGRASSELEAIAEDGNQAPMVALLSGSPRVRDVVDVMMPVTPSGSTAGGFADRVTFTVEAAKGDRFSFAAMLICSNDGFLGLNRVKLPKKRAATYYAYGYDAGTEDNTEKSQDIVDACSGLGPVPLPGDGNGNENDAVATMPQARITRHPGIHGGGDLDPALHGWTGPMAKVTIRPVRKKSRYQVLIENLSTGQPMSPPVVAAHDPRIRMFRKGRPASPEIEAIAENGDPVPMFDLLSGLEGVTSVVNVGMPLTRKGTTVGTFTDAASLEIEAYPGDVLSLATMLICSNDGFTGLSRGNLPGWGERVYYLRAYDAGTEKNTELGTDIVDACSGLGAVSLPGDPNGNENDAVDTEGRIRRHRGIKGVGDLTPADHGWRGRVARITVKRLPDAS